MKEKPILCSKPMVLALRNTKPGTWPAEPIDASKPWKYQTRRLMPKKDYEWWASTGFEIGDDGYPVSEDDQGEPVTIQPPFPVGTRLWVKETFKWSREGAYAGYELSIRYAADNQYVDGEIIPANYCPPACNSHTDNWGSGEDNLPPSAQWGFCTTYGTGPSIFMPRWASRIELEVMEARFQRLQDITEEDAKAEGATLWPHDPQQRMTSGELGIEQPYRGGFACLWDDINEDRATWFSNPWVWAYTLKRLESNNG